MTGEIRHALRRLRATPLVTLSAIACLAIGVWMTCIVSAVGRGFLRPDLEVDRPDRLVQIEEEGLYRFENSRGAMPLRRLTSRSVFDSLVARKTFASIGYYEGPFPAGLRGEPQSRVAVTLSSGMAQVLRLPIALGRSFIPADDSARVAIISPQLWRTLYGGDKSVIGRQVYLRQERQPYTIIGVMREGFSFPRHDRTPDFYFSPGIFWTRDYPIRQMLARLRDDEKISDVLPVVQQVAIRNIAADREELMQFNRARYKRSAPPKLLPGPVNVTLQRYYNEPLPKELLSFLGLILGCGMAVVVIAAANVVNLLLVRGASRRQEIAVRMALGASRSTIVKQLVVETTIVATAGVVIGFLVAFWQWQLIDSGFDGRQFLGQIDLQTALVALAAGIVLTLAVGIWPGLRATSMNLEQVLRDTRRAGIGASPLDGLLGRLVAVSTGATVMLLICFALLALSARDHREIGFASARNIVSSQLSLDERESRQQRAAVVRDATIRLASIPGVDATVIGQAPPYGESMNFLMTPDGAPERRLTTVDVYDIGEAIGMTTYFRMMGVPFIEGRSFLPQELKDSTNAVIVSRKMATTLFPGRSAIGQHFRYLNELDSVTLDGTVVGVVEGVEGGGRDQFQLYRPYASQAAARTPVMVAFEKGAKTDLAAVQATLRSIPGLLSSETGMLDARRQRGLPQILKYVKYGFAQFAIVALILAAVGTYGIVAYSVVRRTHEIGVRMALGAERGRVTWMIVEEGLKVTAIGIIGGVAMSFVTTKLMAALIYDMRTDYPMALVAVALLVLGVSVIACWIPGARAGRLNPVDALRAE